MYFNMGARGTAHKKGGVNDLGKLRSAAVAELSNFDRFIFQRDRIF
jgi:hypothetical protein